MEKGPGWVIILLLLIKLHGEAFPMTSRQMTARNQPTARMEGHSCPKGLYTLHKISRGYFWKNEEPRLQSFRMALLFDLYAVGDTHRSIA